MTRLIPIAIIQSAVLALAQVMLKFALAGFGKWQWSWQFVKGQLTNWYWLGCGVMFTGATVLWMYMLKRFPFSQAYPMSCLSYVFGMIAAMVFFQEQIPLTRWLGILLILCGCILIAR